MPRRQRGTTFLPLRYPLPVRAHPPRATSPARPARPRSVAPDDGGIVAIAGASPTARARFARAGSRASSATSPVGACSASLARAVAAPGRATLAPPRPADAPPASFARRRATRARAPRGRRAGERAGVRAQEQEQGQAPRRVQDAPRRSRWRAPPSKRRGERRRRRFRAPPRRRTSCSCSRTSSSSSSAVWCSPSPPSASSRQVGQPGHRDAVPRTPPIVIGFLVFSSIYGLVKTRDDPNSRGREVIISKKRGGGIEA